MVSPPDPFALNFDSIEVDPARAPSKDAIDNALAACAPESPPAGGARFSLIDDGGGRFVVDREFGVVSLKDESLLARELGAVHPVRLRVVEASGASYELDLKLRLTGRVPQVVGAEDFAAIAGVPATPQQPAPPAPRVAWTAFAPARGAQVTAPLLARGAFGALFAVEMPAVTVSAALTLGAAPPAPSSETAAWSL